MKKKKNNLNSDTPIVDVRIAGSYHKIMDDTTKTMAAYDLSKCEMERVVGYTYGSLAVLLSKIGDGDITDTLSRILYHAHNLLNAYKEIKNEKRERN